MPGMFNSAIEFALAEGAGAGTAARLYFRSRVYKLAKQLSVFVVYNGHVIETEVALLFYILIVVCLWSHNFNIVIPICIERPG